jgi:predicted nucleic acid-binding protein
MRAAYVDTSCLLAIAFEELGAEDATARLLGYDRLFSSNLLEAEFRAGLLREKVAGGDASLAGISWILPDRPLGDEIEKVLSHGYLRGADLWHMACALFLAGEPEHLDFVTLDRRQQDIAARLGFNVPFSA